MIVPSGGRGPFGLSELEDPPILDTDIVFPVATSSFLVWIGRVYSACPQSAVLRTTTAMCPTGGARIQFGAFRQALDCDTGQPDR